MKIIIDKTEILKIKLKLKKSHEKYKNRDFIHSNNFSWEKCAKYTHEIYKSIL